jgi:hypothetical protein
MTNRSTFPLAIDSFNYLSEVLSSDKTNVERYQTLLLKETRTTAEETELTDLKTTLYNAGKIVSSESFNKIFDCMTNLEDYFLNRVMVDLAALDVGILQTDLDAHMSNLLNPHSVTKSQLGLSNVDNIQQATKAEFNIHTSNLTNPHSVTALQVGAYSKSESDTTFAKKVQDNWITFTLQNGWIKDTSTASYRKNNFGEVEIKGRIKNGSTGIGVTITTLPIGYRPIEDKTYAVISHNGGSAVVGQVDILTSGIIRYVAGGNYYLSLDSIPPFSVV